MQMAYRGGAAAVVMARQRQRQIRRGGRRPLYKFLSGTIMIDSELVQEFPTHIGRATLPHLNGHFEGIKNKLNDEQTKVRTLTLLALAALTEASNLFGSESFGQTLGPLWRGTIACYYADILVPLAWRNFAENMVTGMHTSAPGLSNAGRRSCSLMNA